MTAKQGSSGILALIPARGGSKGIPRKNLLPVAGQPLIAHTIRHALQSKHIDRTIVSTDDGEIADIARHHGAEVPFMRPAEFAADLSTDHEVFLHALGWLAGEESYHPELIVHLRPTGPVRKVTLIDQAIEKILAHPDACSLRSIAPAIQSPFKMWQMEDGRLAPVLTLEDVPDAHSMPRQKLPMAYWQNGYVDIVRPRTILEKDSMTGDVVIPFLVNEPIYEIDYPEDVAAVEEALLRQETDEPGNATTPFDDRHPV